MQAHQGATVANVLKRSVVEILSENVSGEWLAHQATASVPTASPVSDKIEQLLMGLANDRKCATVFVATKNDKP